MYTVVVKIQGSVCADIALFYQIEVQYLCYQYVDAFVCDARLDRFNYTQQTRTRTDESEQNTFLPS